jgi:hypothetical protein
MGSPVAVGIAVAVAVMVGETSNKDGRIIFPWGFQATGGRKKAESPIPMQSLEQGAELCRNLSFSD